jgi:hypothetical protein
VLPLPLLPLLPLPLPLPLLLLLLIVCWGNGGVGTTEVSGAGGAGFTVSTAFWGGPVGASVSGLRFVSVITFSHEQTVITRINAISGADFIKG